MRDVRPEPLGRSHLAADVYLPAGDPLNPVGVWPVVLVQTPYDKDAFAARYFVDPERDDPLFQSRDYAFVVLDWRGFHASRDAAYDGSPTRGEDGFDAVEWIADQPWCDGNVGTWGASALGNVQLHTAVERPPHLRACVPMVYHFREWYDQVYPGGVYARNRNQFVYGLFGGLEIMRSIPYYDWVWALLESGRYDISRVDVPMLHISGWYDHETLQTIREFVQIQDAGGANARGRQKLLVGPWAHSSVGAREQGDLEYPAAEDVASEAALAFFDHHLRGVANGAADWPAVQYFSINADTWESADTWPPTIAVERDLWLHVDGALAEAPAPTTSTLGYVSDPTDPVPTRFGPVLGTPFHTQGPGDLESVEARGDVLTFTTPVQARPLMIAGSPRVRLYVQCDAVDTDVAVRLTDVWPDGRSNLLVSGVRRASLRNTFATPEWLEPNDIVAVEVELTPIAVTIPAGHALRLSVAPSNYPLYDVNMQDGSSISDEAGAAPVVADVTLWLGGGYDAALTLPVVHGGCARADLDGDGAVDVRDLDAWAVHAGGPEAPVGAPGDVDGDGDADLHDFVSMQRCAGPLAGL